MTTQKLTLTFPLNLSFSLPKKTFLYLVLLTISFSVILSLVFYLFQVGKIIEESYLIETYNKEVNTISEQNLLLEKKQTELLSLNNIEKKINELNFVEVSEITYIPISSDYLVKEISQ